MNTLLPPLLHLQENLASSRSKLHPIRYRYQEKKNNIFVTRQILLNLQTRIIGDLFLNEIICFNLFYTEEN